MTKVRKPNGRLLGFAPGVVRGWQLLRWAISTAALGFSKGAAHELGGFVIG
jgi:hypothetical protein